MEGVMHIGSMASAPWCAWIMLMLLFCGIFCEWLQPGLISKAGTTLTARITDRMYKDAPTNFLGQVFVTIFRIGTIALAICLCFNTNKGVTFSAFAAVCGIILAVLSVKMVFNTLLDYTFSLSRRFGDMYDHYANIITITALILYPVVLILLRIGNTVLCRWILGIAAVLFLCMWVYRSIRTFVASIPGFLYWIIYICTLEVLPLIIMIYLSGKTISLL